MRPNLEQRKAATFDIKAWVPENLVLGVNKTVGRGRWRHPWKFHGGREKKGGRKRAGTAGVAHGLPTLCFSGHVTELANGDIVFIYSCFNATGWLCVPAPFSFTDAQSTGLFFILFKFTIAVRMQLLTPQ